jgi:hypothetical protein
MKRKKLIYVPGLISILGLPILLFFWGPGDPVQLTSLRIRIPTDEKDSGGIKRFSKEGFLELTKNKKLTTIDLGSGSPYIVDIKKYPLTDRKFQFVTRAIEQLEFTNDTSSVLKIDLAEGNTYGEFVWLLNQATIYNIRRYALIDNSFYFLANPPVIREPDLVSELQLGFELESNFGQKSRYPFPAERALYKPPPCLTALNILPQRRFQHLLCIPMDILRIGISIHRIKRHLEDRSLYPLHFL